MSDDYEIKRLEVKEVTDQGQVEAVISTFQLDRDGDVMTAEAFKGSDGKTIPMVWSHNWDMPIGKGVVSVQKDEAVFSGQFNLATQAGREAYEAVKFMGPLQEYSIGFRTLDADFGYKEDAAGQRVYTRTIKDIELFEASPVLVGAAYGTRTLAVKGIGFKAEWDAAYINNLPDSAFAIVLPGGEKDDQGKTVPRNLRLLPHHNAQGAIDMPHLRNALSREPQADMSEAQHAAAHAHLQRHAEAEGVGDTSQTSMTLAGILVALDHLAEQKAGAVLSAMNLGRLHDAMNGMMALHDASNCPGGDNCPLDGMMAGKYYNNPPGDGRDKALREMEKALGYRPLIADRIL